jgi:hypothetical protein
VRAAATGTPAVGSAAEATAAAVAALKAATAIRRRGSKRGSNGVGGGH